MTNAGEEVMLNLEVEAAQIPSQKAIVSREVDRGQDLVGGPSFGQPFGSCQRLGEIRFLHAVGKLEDDAEDDTDHERGPRVIKDHDPPRVKQHWDQERPAEEKDLAADELD